MRVTRRVVIDKLSDEIFAFLAQPENHPRFVPGLIEFRLVSQEMGADARLVGTRRDFGLRQRLSYRVSEFEPPQTIALIGRSGPLEGTATYRLSPLGPNQTELTFEIEGRLRGPLRVADRLLGPVLGAAPRRPRPISNGSWRHPLSLRSEASRPACASPKRHHLNARSHAMLRSRLTERFKMDHPVISAPMGFAAGGKLAAAVSAAGGLGLIGGGYGDERWLREQIAVAGKQRVGCGFITWSLKKQPHLLDIALDGAPAAMFLSFGDPQPFARRIKQAGVPLICQIQTTADARRAIEVGADVVVAQGAEAGGHGSKRATFTLVPEVADLIAAHAPDTLLCAAGGVADGRGLAAALVLGADGVVVGTRFWASEEALVHPNPQAAAVSASGDDTLRSRVIDMMRGLDFWPARYDLRTLRSAATDRWDGNEAELRAVAEAEVARYAEAAARGDARNVSAVAGEAVGLIHDIAPARDLLRAMISEAEVILRKAPSWLTA